MVQENKVLLDILGSAGFGSLLGGIFGYLSKREERETMQMKFNHEVNILEAKTKATIEVAKMNVEEVKVAGMLLVDKLEAEAFVVSQKVTSKFSEALKSLIRPLILGVLMYQTYLILNSLEELTGGLESLPTEDVVNLYKIVVLSVTGLTATAVGWYFAARSSKQFDKLVDKWKI